MNPVFIHRDDERHGPFPWSDIRNLVESGHFTWDDFAWHEGMDSWEPLHVVYERLAVLAPPPSKQIEMEESEAPGFFSALPRAFLYPFRGPNKWAVFFFILGMAIVIPIVKFAAFFGSIASILLHGYYFAYLFRVIQESAGGEDEAAEFPGIQNVWDDIFMPFVKVLFLILGCFLPAIVAAVAIPAEAEEFARLPLLLVFGGLFYMPMAFLCMVMFNSVLDGLNPLIGVPAIFRIFLRYAIIVVFIAAIVFGYGYAETLAGERLDFLIALPLMQFVFLYIGIILGRILGLIYQTSADELGWFTR